METTSQRISMLSSSTIYTVSCDLESGNTDFRTIDELISGGEVGSFWVLAKVCSLENEAKWWYLACKRFKVQIRVIDGTGNTSFLLWDRECTELIGKNASALLDEITTKSGIDSIPAEIEALVDREVLFKVQVRDQNINFPKAAYTVTRVTEYLLSSDDVTTPIKKSTTIDHSGDMREGSVTKRSLAGELSSNVAEKKLKSVVKQENE
ncbi:Uncharacterized protein Adt_19418 [Abeliophyllum distichum]|uniref:Replication factor A C-terminal domain-containing protein n=1 Tax=Abeliophyllum distichum TaxID=126358 RepID=A0ABD1SVC1_9LAMI